MISLPLTIVIQRSLATKNLEYIYVDVFSVSPRDPSLHFVLLWMTKLVEEG